MGEAYQELLEEILNNLEEAVEEENWDGIDDVVSQIREALIILLTITILKIGKNMGLYLEIDRCYLTMESRD